MCRRIRERREISGSWTAPPHIHARHICKDMWRATYPYAGDLYIFCGRRGDLAKILWHDGIGLSLYAKRPDRGKFIWPSATAGAVGISAAQMAYMLEEIDWRHPQLTYRPQSERYEGFIEALGRRLNQGRTLLDEIPRDMLRNERADENATDSRE
jgi:transposase